MTFTIRKTRNRPWPVTVKTKVCDEAGQVDEVAQTFIVHWKPFTEVEFKSVIDAAEAAHPAVDGEDTPLSKILAKNAIIFTALIEGWGDEVKDEAGKPVTYSAKALSGLIQGPDGLAVSGGLNAALTELRFGIAPAKNSNASPAPGPVTEPVEAAEET